MSPGDRFGDHHVRVDAEVESHRLPDQHFDCFRFRLVLGNGDPDLVAARAQAGEREAAVGLGRGLVGEAARHLACGHAGAGQHAAGIGDGSLNCRG